MENEKERLELLILEDIKEWVEIHLLDGTWDQTFEPLLNEEYDNKLDEVMDIYWKNHIFPIDDYVK